MRVVGLILLLSLPPVLEAQRVHNGNQIVSSELPKAILEAGPGMIYAGTQTFDLYGVANAEQHFFVDLDGSRIKRLLWIQYEGYHPVNTYTYDYEDPKVQHSGRAWFRDISASRVPVTEARPGGDGARARAFVKAKGWTIGPYLMQERLVWIVDSVSRHELMVIYMEDFGTQGVAPADTSAAGKEAFHRRAAAAFTVKDH